MSNRFLRILIRTGFTYCAN